MINATGARADFLRRDVDPDADPKIAVNAGAHIILPKYYQELVLDDVTLLGT